MESDSVDAASGTNIDAEGLPINSTILEYYKKFGRKRDLEQYFALNTAQGDIKDLSSIFWRRMKSQESSDSGEKSKESSLEVCRISIKCSAFDTDPGSSQDEKEKTKESDSPPIIVEEVNTPSNTSRHSDNDSVKSDDYQSQKSMDVALDTSMNKVLSPTSSVTSQRKLEWDSLADVGYANESDKKTSASSLSTLERLALKQQYSNNDTDKGTLMGAPTAHSTPVDENDSKVKNRRGSKITKIYRKEVDFVELNLPHTSDANPAQSINVNLTKHISLNVDKSGVSVENIKKDISYIPEKRSVETEMTPHGSCDKEVQTSLVKKQDKSSSSDLSKPVQLYGQAVPVLINLNSYKKRHRRKKFVAAKKKLRSRNKEDDDKENIPVQEKSNDQVSEAESFEYMPGHIYNQNKINKETVDRRSDHVAGPSLAVGNKSSLESSGAVTTDSSKYSKPSFSKDLEKSIKLLKTTLNKRYEDSDLKQKLVKEVVQRLLQTSYKDDESSTDFLSGLSFSSKKIGLHEGNTTTSTSDANNTTGEKTKVTRPKKSILRVDKFNPSVVPSTSQSAPNLPVASNSENPVSTSLSKTLAHPYTESDSSKEKTTSDNVFAKTSSEELYQKYLDALRREEAYKKHLKEKEMFLKHKLVCSDVPLNVPASARLDSKSQLRLKELLKDLTRNNYDDGSGDASKLEGGFMSNINIRPAMRTLKSHSVFTLSSAGNSDTNRRSNMKKNDTKEPKAGHSKEMDHYCCCPHHYANKLGVTDSAVQVNIPSNESTCRKKPSKDVSSCRSGKCKASQPITLVPDEVSGEIKYLCMCNTNIPETKNVPENRLIYKCSRLIDQEVQSEHSTAKSQKYECKGSQTCIPESVQEIKPKERIHEAIRIIQTDISINPRISDPSISDIKLIKDCDCVKLVGEHYREVSKTSIESRSSSSDQRDVRIGACECPEVVSSTSAGRGVQSDPNVVRVTINSGGQFGDNINIQADGLTVKESTSSNHASQLPANCTCTQTTNDIAYEQYQKPQAVDTIFARGETSNIDKKLTALRGYGDAKQVSRSTSPVPSVSIPSAAPAPENIKSLKEPSNDNVTARKSPRKTPCGCPESDRCGGFCDKGSICRQEGKKEILPLRSSPRSPRKSPQSKAQTYPQKNEAKKIRSVRSQSLEAPKVYTFETTPKLDKRNVQAAKQALNDNITSSQDDERQIGESTSHEERKRTSLSSEPDQQHSKGLTTSHEERLQTSSSNEPKQQQSRDLIMEAIRNITKRYSKKDLEKSQRKKCFKEILSVLNYLLDTEDSSDAEALTGLQNLAVSSSTSDSEQPKQSDLEFMDNRKDECENTKPRNDECQNTKNKLRFEQCQSMNMESRYEEKKVLVDKGVQQSCKRSKSRCTGPAELAVSSELPCTSSDSVTCHVLNRIRKECEKYHHQRRCKCQSAKRCDSSTTSVNCEHCKRVHHCSCRTYNKCKYRPKNFCERLRKKCVAYNLIIQTSESMVSEENTTQKTCRPLKNIIVKVPSKKPSCEAIPCSDSRCCSPRCDGRRHRSRSVPNESSSSTVESLRAQLYCVKDYLEKNRPDFIEQSAKRLNRLQMIRETRASNRAAQRELVSMQVQLEPTLRSLSSDDLRALAREAGISLNREPPKLVSEREMKQHSSRIYRRLPEVLRRKEEARKENIKKTNQLMASIFKKSLQKRALRGSVNLSHYSPVVKI